LSEPQFIGEDPVEQAVIISFADLAALCQASAKTLTFGEALARVGFRPETMPKTARLEIRQRPRRREKLTIDSQDPAAAERKRAREDETRMQDKYDLFGSLPE
jgi:hypothetical protein